ncbi:MAG: M56 family metallopeptidase [Fusicatenibacter sp.]|nr:M56 family metallopeptidase [Fusicatenibacter sp.]
MFDLWAFLLQTLTASGVAVLLLVIKALFRDKLPPKWHFAVWGVLGIMILLPAGFNGRYTLFHWQLVVEMMKSWVGDYSFTQVLFPVPILTTVPKTLIQWIFAGYILGVVMHIAKYLAFYIRLRLVLRNGVRPGDELTVHIQKFAAAQKVKIGRIIAVPGLPSAFVCGIIHPVLVLPADHVIDDKVILHELLHMKYKDTLWSVVICLQRSLHWCNPLIIYCANRALNDMETRCDQHVLEQLHGEERRDYGRILLSMASDRFAKTPGSTCINNGGKKIRERIEAIARFRKYPAGMKLVSVCVMILLSLSLVVGVQASTVYESGNSIWFSLASARSTPCTTAAGAFDTYGKAIVDQNGIYRAMCAPESMQEEIQNEMLEKEKTGIYPNWDCGLNEWPDTQSGYYIYNLKQCDKNAYEGLLVVKVNDPPSGQAGEKGEMYLAVQNLRVEKENGRWIAIPLDDFQNVEAAEQSLDWGCLELPGMIYSGIASNICVDVKVQTVYSVESTVQTENSDFLFGNSISYFDTIPKPNAEFTRAARIWSESLTHLGTKEERDRIEGLGLSIAPKYSGEKRPENLADVTGYNSGGASSSGESWGGQRTEPGWGPTIELHSGGGGTFDPKQDAVLPEYYVADLYVNDELVAQLDLHRQEGVI